MVANHHPLKNLCSSNRVNFGVTKTLPRQKTEFPWPKTSFLPLGAARLRVQWYLLHPTPPSNKSWGLLNPTKKNLISRDGLTTLNLRSSWVLSFFGSD